MENTFNEGDRVQVVKRVLDSGRVLHMTGTIRVQDIICGNVGVEFDEDFPGGHDLGGSCENGRGWWVHPEALEFLGDTVFESPSDSDFAALLFG